MPFEFPNWEQVLYRAWRLRRLIAFANAIPFVIFALLGLVGLNSLTDSVGGLLALTVVHFAIIAAHAVLFPNATDETLTVAILLAAFGLIMAIFPVLIGLILCLGLGVWAMMWGQVMLTNYLGSSEAHDPETTARVKVKAEPDAVRAFFPLRPNSIRGQFKCGPADAKGAFPVWHELATVDIFADTPAGEDGVLDKVMSKLGQDGADLTDRAAADTGAKRDPMQEPPSFWAEVEIDEPAFQRTRLFFRQSSGEEEESSVVEHRFKAKKGYVVVSETDSTQNYPKGLSASMWLNDFQLDGLIYLRELLENTAPKSLRSAHRWSLLTLAGQWFALKNLGRAGEA